MKWFRNIKLGTRLSISFFILVVIMGIIGYTGMSDLNKLDQNSSDLYHLNTVPIEKLGEYQQRFHRVRVIIMKLVIAESPSEVQKYMDEVKTHSEAITKLIDEIEAGMSSEKERQLASELKPIREEYREQLNVLFRLGLENNDKEAFQYVEGVMLNTEMKYQNYLENWAAINSEEAKLRTEGNAAEAAAAVRLMLILLFAGVVISVVFAYFITTSITRPVAKVLNLARELTKGHVKARAGVDSRDEVGVMAQTLDQFGSQLESFAGAMYQISRGDVSVSVPSYDKDDELAPALNAITATLKNLDNETAVLINAAINGRLDERGDASKFEGGYRKIIEGINQTLDAVIKPVKEGSGVLEIMATGDLTVRVTGDYKGDHQIIKDSINKLGVSISEALTEVSEAVQATASASTQISSSTEEMAAGAQEQSSQAAEVATAVEQMATTIIATSKNASSAAENAKQAGDIANDGGRVVEETVNRMNRIAEVVEESAVTIKQLGTSSNQIGEIIQVIDDIADQTNLLALNAAIEAARAGEQGRGFAVVADEVRKLAERTTKATKEIASMIKQIQVETGGVIQSISQGTQEVKEGKELAGRAGESLRSIISASQKVLDVVYQVASASEEQSTAAEQISKNIEGISSVAQQSAAGTQQVARASEDLNRLTENLQTLISRFKIGKSGRSMGVRSNGKLIEY